MSHPTLGLFKSGGERPCPHTGTNPAACAPASRRIAAGPAHLTHRPNLHSTDQGFGGEAEVVAAAAGGFDAFSAPAVVAEEAVFAAPAPTGGDGGFGAFDAAPVAAAALGPVILAAPPAGGAGGGAPLDDNLFGGGGEEPTASNGGEAPEVRAVRLPCLYVSYCWDRAGLDLARSGPADARACQGRWLPGWRRRQW